MSIIGALIIRIGFRGPVYYNYNKEAPRTNSIGHYLGPYSMYLGPYGMYSRIPFVGVSDPNVVPYVNSRTLIIRTPK